MKKMNNKVALIVGVLILILVLLIFIPALLERQKELELLQHEEQLIRQGKVKNDRDVINAIVEILKERNESKLQQYLASNFLYYDNNNIEHKYISDFWDDLQYLVDDQYDIEKRENSVEDKETYIIYWNEVEENKKNGINKSSEYYCLQKITIILKRIVKEDIITYDIEKIILTDN